MLYSLNLSGIKSVRAPGGMAVAKSRGVVMGNPVSAKRADERAEALRAEIADCRLRERRVRANSGNAGHAHHAGTNEC